MSVNGAAQPDRRRYKRHQFHNDQPSTNRVRNILARCLKDTIHDTTQLVREAISYPPKDNRGSQFECDAALDRLRIVFEVVSVSRPYRSSRQSDSAAGTVRVYVQVRDKPQPATPAGRRGQQARGRRAGQPSPSREAPRLARELADRFGCPPGTFELTWIGPKQGWEVRWQDGPNREQVRHALADLAGPAFPAFTEILAARKLRTWRSISQRGWALHLVGLAAAGEQVPNLDDATVHWATEAQLQDRVAIPAHAAAPALEAATDELLSLVTALQPGTGQGRRIPADERDLAPLLRRHGLEAIASGAVRQALHDDAGVVPLTSRVDRLDPQRPPPQPGQARRPP